MSQYSSRLNRQPFMTSEISGFETRYGPYLSCRDLGQLISCLLVWLGQNPIWIQSLSNIAP